MRGPAVAIAEQEIFELGTDAFNAHDLGSIELLLADDVVLSAPGASGTGKAACVEFYGRWFEAFPDAHLDVHAVYALGDVLIEEGTFTGTHTGIAPTGRPVALDYVRVLRTCAGKHVEVNVTFDRLLMLEQLGLVTDADATARALSDA